MIDLVEQSSTSAKGHVAAPEQEIARAIQKFCGAKIVKVIRQNGDLLGVANQFNDDAFLTSDGIVSRVSLLQHKGAKDGDIEPMTDSELRMSFAASDLKWSDQIDDRAMEEPRQLVATWGLGRNYSA